MAGSEISVSGGVSDDDPSASFNNQHFAFKDPATPGGFFSRLSNDILQHIFNSLTISKDKTVLNQAMGALRCSSSKLMEATNALTLSVTFQSITQCQSAMPLLSKLGGITAVTLNQKQVSRYHKNICNTPGSQVRFTSAELRLASEVVQAHWSLFLQHLELDTSCNLPPCANGNVTATHGLWSPDLPALRSLVIRNGSVVILDLTKCPVLQKLVLENNASLEYCEGFTTSPDLHTIKCIHSTLLIALDFSRCKALRNLVCDRNEIISLVLEGCQSLQKLDLKSCRLLSGLNLSSCTSLQDIVCVCNEKLDLLVLPVCPNLTSVKFTYTHLTKLDMSRQRALQTVVCMDNAFLEVCDVSGCVSLQSVNVSTNDVLEVLDVTGLGLLSELVCSSNPKLSAVRVLGCRALKTVECSRNNAMTRLDLTHCGVLTSLLCVSNMSLAYLDLSDCKELQLLDRRWSSKLGAIDVSSCRSLVSIITA